jgi:competence protein ComEC
MTAGVVLRINAVSMLTAIAFAVTGITLNAAVYHFRGKQRNQFIFIQILVFIFLFLLGYFITFSHDISDNGLKNQEGQLKARIEKVTAGEYSTRLMLSDCRYDGEKMNSKIVLEISQTDGAAGGFKRGDCIDAHVILQEAAAATNPGQFGQRAYYKALGYGFYVKKVEITDVWHEKDFVIDTLEAVKTRLKGVYEECCEYTDAGVYEAMVLGDKSDMDGSLKGLFSAAGIGHILAISGLHISLIGMGLYKLLRKTGIIYPAAAIISGTLVVLYGSMTGNSVSSVRAIVMFCCAVYAQAAGRTYDILSAVSLAAIIIMCKNPYIVTDAGFLLSFLAIAGVSAVSGGFTAEKLKWFTAPLSIWLATLPVMLWFYYEIPLFSIVLNLAVVPLMSFIMVSALLCGVAGLVSSTFGTFFAGIGHYILLLFRYGCELMLSIPGSVYVAGRPEIEQIIIYYVFLILFSLRKNIVCGVRRIVENRCRRYTVSLRDRCGRIAGVLVRLLIIPALAVIFMRNRSGLEAVFLDVGQGDAIFVSMPDGSNIFIDGGSSSQNGIYDRILEPFFKYKGVRKLDFLFITHSDEDHYNGWSEALKNLREDALTYIPSIENVVLNAGDYGKVMVSDAGSSLDFLNGGLECNAVLSDCAGTVYRFGDCSLTSLNDCEKIYGTESENDNSIVLLLRYGDYSILFTGDVTSEREEMLTERVAECGVEHVSLLKAAHHGSRYSTSSDFLQSIRPRAAVISCAAKNSYGHPHSETLERLDASGTKVYRVDESGAVTAWIDEKSGVMGMYGWR